MIVHQFRSDKIEGKLESVASINTQISISIGEHVFDRSKCHFFFFVDLRSFAFLQNASKYFKFTKNSSWRIFVDFRYLFIIYLVQSVKINNCLNHGGPLFTAVNHGWPLFTTWETCLAFSKVIFVEQKYLLTPSRFGWNKHGAN